MDGLHLLGATTGLSSQYVTLRITDIDEQKLRAALGSSGDYALAGLSFANARPKAALDIAVPFIKSGLKGDYGITTEITVSNVPPEKGGRAISEFFPGLAIGVGIGAAGLVILKGSVWLTKRLMGR